MSLLSWLWAINMSALSSVDVLSFGGLFDAGAC